MTFLFILALIVYVLICVGLVAFILAQEGKGGGLSGIMGSSTVSYTHLTLPTIYSV